MAKQAYTRPGDHSVLPPLPAGTTMTYAQRTLGGRAALQHLDNPNTYGQTFIATGLFADPTKQVFAALGKVAAAYIDFDLTDSLANLPEMSAAAKAYLETQGITCLYKGGKEVQLSDIDPADSGYAKDLIKRMISITPVAKIKDTIAKHFVPMMEKHVIPFIGKPQKITYTGHGAHAYYWIDDAEGYTTDGANHVEGDVTVNADEFKSYFKGLFAHINRESGYKIIDAAVKDFGTRVTRECGSHNTKAQLHPKLVEDMLPELVDASRRLRLEDLKAIPEAAPATEFAAKVANAGKKAGRPASFKPVRVEHDSTVEVMLNGKTQTMTVEQLAEHFDDLMKIQGQVDKVRDVRLTDHLGQGSLNMFAVRQPEGMGVMFMTNASKYMKQGDRHWKDDGAGNYIGHWLYDGLAMKLLRDGKGRIKKNTHNIQTILMCDKRIAGKLRYNARLETVFVHRDIHLEAHGNIKRERRIAKNTEWFRLVDNHYITFEKMLNDPYGLDNVSDGQMQRCLKSAAMRWSYDPVTEWIENVKWDGVRRLDGDNAWICKMLGMDRSHAKWGLYAAYGRCVMLGILRNIYIGATYPDVQHVLTLTGGQGVGKSLLASTLALTEEIGMDYFHDSGIDMGAGAHRGDQLQAMLGCFLVELPEAISLSSSTTDASVKAFLTTKKDKGRMAYGREQSERLRSTYFVTNSNDQIFLSDHTGNRRYLIIDCFDHLSTFDGRLDINSLRAVLPQLYAEAYQRCVRGKGIPADRQAHVRKYEGVVCEDWNLTLEESKSQALHNEKFTQPDYIVEQLGDILAAELERGITQVSYAEIKTKLAKRDQTARLSNIKFANAMTRCGWRKAQVNGSNRWQPKNMGEVQARARIEPVEAAPLQPVAEDLDALFATVSKPEFKQICKGDQLATIEKVAEAIRNSEMVMPVQVTLLARQVNRVINAQ